jgi:DNA-binding response OmpR family regulator
LENENPNDAKSETSDVPPTAGATDAVETKSSSMIVVLAKREAGLRSTVAFLERRGFAAKLVSSLNEAVELFSKKEANKLLLSVNFPHPKVEMLPVLMNQSFQIETILFAEESDRKSSNRLSDAKTKHVLFGPVSGPVVMMKIRQIDRELSGETDEAAAADKRTMSSKDDEGDIKVGGRNRANEDTVVLNGKTASREKAKLEKLMKSLADGEDDSTLNSSDELARSGETYVQKGNRSKMKSAGDDSGAGSDLLSDRAQKLRMALDAGLIAPPKGASRVRLIMPNNFKSPRRAGAPDDAAATEEASALAVVPMPTELAFESNDLSPSIGPRAGHQVPADENHPAPITASPAKQRVLTTEEIVRLCLRESLAIVAGRPATEGEQLENHRHAALVSLRSPQLVCAFVVSINYSKQTANELFYRMEVAFFSLLRDHGIEFENNETYSIYLDNMRIVRDAFASSEFAVITQSNEIEIGAAKVLIADPIAKTEMYEDNMHAIKLQDVPLNEPVTFNLFLHFKRNQKFLRYLRVGSSMSGKQLHRLERHQATGLVEQNEIEAFQRHFAAFAIQAPKKRAA